MSFHIERNPGVIGLMHLHGDDERAALVGWEITLVYGWRPPFKPELQFGRGVYSRNIWRGRDGQRVDFGDMFESYWWVNPYGVCGSRWDRWFRLSTRRAVDRLRRRKGVSL